MRVATFNLWSGRSLPPDAGAGAGAGAGTGAPAIDAGRLTRSVASLAELGVDVLAVQEVDHSQPRSDGADQLAEVARAFGARAWRFVPTLTGVPGPSSGWQRLAPSHHDGLRGQSAPSAGPPSPSYGIGLVSRLPVLAWRVRALRGSRAVLPLAVPSPGRLPRLLLVPDEPRVALAAVVAGPSGPVTVICTHLSFAPLAARRQLLTVVRWAASLPGPRVIAGDLNLPGPVPGWLTGWASLGRSATYPAHQPRLQLDHLLSDTTAPVAAGPARVVALEVSDHLALVADVPGAGEAHPPGQDT